MSAPSDSWPALSFLEGLRPGLGESVDLALVASYSADLGSIGATLLALAGKGTDSGRGSASDFADAVERLRGKVRIIIQRGRLAKMHKTPRIAAVMDQFVREVDFDEAVQSWHPKAALIRTANQEGEVGWRLWIGSRNLTECVNHDTGLFLVSSAKGGAKIPGAEDIARALAEKAELKGQHPDTLAATIANLAWRTPTGVKVQRIRWSTGTGDLPVPIPSAGTEEVVVVSPFVDKKFLAQQVLRGAKPVRTLLTSMREIERIGPCLATFDELLALDAPDYPPDDPESELHSDQTVQANVIDESEEEQIGGGLHAKLLFYRSRQKRHLWLGSANATMRAWTGRNVEVAAELLVSESIEKGLRALLGSARLVEAQTIEYSPDAATLEKEALERARAQVAARWAATLTFDGENMRVIQHSARHLGGPHPDDPNLVLEVGTLTGQLIQWPSRKASVNLGSVVASERSELLRLRLSRGNKGLSWLQRAQADPPFGEERDRAAFVRLLGARGFLLWLAGLLAEDGNDTEGDWTTDERRRQESSRIDPIADFSLPTLEDMLAAWARNPKKFRDIEVRVSQYLPALLQQAKLEEEPQAAEMLKSFDDLWRKLTSGLGLAKA